MSDRRSTDDLIRHLAAAHVPARYSPAAMLGGVAGLMLSGLVLYFAGFGLRSDLFAAWAHLPVQAKTVLPGLLSVLAIWLALRSARPEGRVVLWPVLVPVLLAFMLAAYRIHTAEGPLLSETLGRTALACLGSIGMLSALPLALGIHVLRRAAPTRPVLTGALLGVAVGAGVAAGYALHCTEDSPLFFVSWYGLAITVTGGVGGWMGHRILRW